MTKYTILVVSPFGVYPPKGGGHARIYNLNLELSKRYYKIRIFAQGLRKEEINISRLKSSWETQISDNYSEYRYVNIFELPIRLLLQESSWFFIKNFRLPPIFTGKFLSLFPNPLSKFARTCDLITVEHPWQFRYVFEINKEYGLPLVLDEIDIEYDAIHSVKINTRHVGYYKWLLRKVKELEEFAVNNADIIFAVSHEDKTRIYEIYGIEKNNIYVIPNGINVDKFKSVKEIGEKERDELKRELGLKNKRVVLFIGSKHEPNVEAVQFILEIAMKMQKIDKDVVFVIVGNVNERFKNTKIENVIFIGFVADTSIYHKIADIALNPVIFGAGTNVKMFEYMASGLPIITTPFGARGIELENYKHAIIADRSEFIEKITELLTNEDLKAKLGTNARKLAEEKYDWKVIAEKVDKIYRKIIR